MYSINKFVCFKYFFQFFNLFEDLCFEFFKSLILKCSTEKLRFMIYFDSGFCWNFQKFCYLSVLDSKLPPFMTFCFKSVFQVFDMIFPSYDLFKTKKRYYLIPRSLHLCFRSISKTLKIFHCCHFSFLGVSEMRAFWIFRFF